MLLLFLLLGLMSRGQRSDLHMHPLHALRALQQSVDSCVLSTLYLVLASVLTCLMLIRYLDKASGKQPSTKAAFHNSKPWLLSYSGKLDVRENIHFLSSHTFPVSLSLPHSLWCLGGNPEPQHTPHTVLLSCVPSARLSERNKCTLKQGNW